KDRDQKRLKRTKKSLSGKPISTPICRTRSGCCARRERPRHYRAAECSQQFPPSDGDCHTPLPREVRKRKDSDNRRRHEPNSLTKAFASFRSSVSKLSVNQP